MGTEKKRRQMISRILYSIQAASNEKRGVDEKKLIALICIENGVTMRKAKEYIDLLIDSEKVLLKEDGLWFKEQTF